MSGRRLIVSGDDFGAAREVNAGIIHAHREGVLSSASLMVAGSAVDEAVELARAHPGLAVGLHLVLTQGRPTAPPADIPALVRPDGSFGDVPVLTGFAYAQVWASRSGRRQLRREVDAQLDAFCTTGLELAHVDGHCNMHLHPMILPILLELAPRYGVRAVRLTRDPIGPALRHDASHLGRKLAEGIVFGALASWAAPRLRAAGIRFADRVLGMHQTGAVDEDYLLAVLRDLPEGTTEIYCHPAVGSAPEMARHQPGYRHEMEVRALTSPRVREAITAAGVEVVSYRDLATAPA